MLTCLGVRGRFGHVRRRAIGPGRRADADLVRRVDVQAADKTHTDCQQQERGEVVSHDRISGRSELAAERAGIVRRAGNGVKLTRSVAFR